MSGLGLCGRDGFHCTLQVNSGYESSSRRPEEYIALGTNEAQACHCIVIIF